MRSTIYLILITFFLCNCKKSSPTASTAEPVADVNIGACYFGGWYENSAHITNDLRLNYPERMPIWGWVTSTPTVMQAQIDLASAAGIHFFAFCWYFDKDLSENKGANIAIQQFVNAPNKTKMKFCYLVSNHEGYYIKKNSWSVLKEHWKRAFQDPSYLKVDGKPVLLFFDYQSFIDDFGSAQAVNDTLNRFRNEIVSMGMNGVLLGINAWPSTGSISKAMSCGFDFVAGYNYRSFVQVGLNTPIENMYNTEYSTIYNTFKNAGIKSIPVSTLNFDKRPWSDNPSQEKIFTGFSKNSVFHSVYNLRKWIKENPSATINKLGLLYAWNEYGEGAWLTPSVPLKDSLLQGVKEAMKN